MKEKRIDAFDPLTLIMDPRSYFLIWFLIICLCVVINTFVRFPFDGKCDQTTETTAVVQEVVSKGNYKLRISKTGTEIEYRTLKKYEAGESLNGYYDGVHFLTEKQAKKRGILPVVIWAVPCSVILWVLFYKFLIAFIRTALGGSKPPAKKKSKK